MKTKLVHLKLDPARIARITRAGRRKGISFDEAVSEAVAAFLNAHRERE